MGVLETYVVPKFKAISCASSGDNEIIAKVTGRKIRVLSYVLVAASAVTAQWQDDDGTLSGVMSLGANDILEAAPCPWGHFETTSGEALDLNLGGAVQVSGHLTYQEIP